MLLIMKLSLIFCLSSIVSCQSDENAKGGGRGKYWNYLFNNIILIKLFFKGKSEITTLDGVFYRFNGNGEYTFMEIDEIQFNSQVRMTPYVNKNGLKRKLSVITALAVKNDNKDSVQIELNHKNQKLDVFVNGKDLSYYDDVKTVNIRVFSDNIIL